MATINLLKTNCHPNKLASAYHSIPLPSSHACVPSLTANIIYLLGSTISSETSLHNSIRDSPINGIVYITWPKMRGKTICLGNGRMKGILLQKVQNCMHKNLERLSCTFGPGNLCNHPNFIYLLCLYPLTHSQVYVHAHPPLLQTYIHAHVTSLYCFY